MTVISFLHIWALPLGLAAMTTPLLIHWLTRPRPVTVKLSTVKFVLDVVRQRQARNRLRDWLILILRMVAVCAFAFMIARPLSRHGPLAAQSDTSSQMAKIVIFDVSQSLAATSQGIRSIERARPLAAKHLGYQSNVQANLLMAAATPNPVFDRPSTNFAVLMDHVTKAEVLPHRLNIQLALNQAAEMLSVANSEKREVVVVSDFQRSHWAAADFSVLPADTAIQLESVAPAETAANLAILKVASQGRVERDRPFRIEVDIGNYSPQSREVTVEVRLGDQLLRLQGVCVTGGRTTLVTEATFSQEGWITGEAKLVGIDDALSDDNRRAIAIMVYPKPTYLLLTRQSAESKPSSSYFLERAIAPSNVDLRSKQENVVRADPLRVTREAIMKSDALLLDHPGKLTEDTLQLMAGLVLRGRGLLYIAAEPVDATNLKLFAKAAGSNLQMPVEFSPAANGQVRKNLFVADVKRRLMPFRAFGDDATALLSPIRFSGGLASRRVEGTLFDDVLATYNDQSACLTVTACGAGSVAVLNTDLATSTLPASPAFVPMIGELTNHLLGVDRVLETAACGESLAVYLPPAASPVVGLRIESSVTSGSVAETLGELREEPVGVLWQVPCVGPPGIYEVKRDSQTLFAMPAAIPTEEADLAAIDPELLTGRLSGGRQVKYRSIRDEEPPHDESWVWLAMATLGCLFAEIVGLRLFKS